VWRRWDECLFVLNVSREARAAAARPEHSFRVISLESLTGDEKFPALDLVSEAEVTRRLRRGDVCCIAEVDGRIAAYAWTGYHSWNLDDIAVRIPLDDDECYLYDAYITPEYRGHGIFYPLTRYLWEVNRARGLQTMYARIRRRNVAAIAGIRFFGAIERLELKSTQVLSFLRIYHATLATGSGRTISLLMAPRTEIGIGLLTWWGLGRRGSRLNLPLAPRFLTSRHALPREARDAPSQPQVGATKEPVASGPAK
jgi:GNAT superfamily N-acetyltransferase